MSSSESVLAVIPARYASSRFPGKPLATINGVSMIRHVYERTASARRVNRVVVATDDERIRDHVEAFGGMAVMTSTAHASGTDRIAEAAEIVGGADIVINVQGDEPMLDPALIDALVDALTASDCGCATPVRPITDAEHLRSPNVVKVALAAGNRALYFSRSPIPFLRDAPIEEWPRRGMHFAHIGLYAYRAEALRRFVAAEPSALERCEQLEQLRLYDLGIPLLCVVTDYDGHAVDHPHDVAVVERRMARRSRAQ